MTRLNFIIADSTHEPLQEPGYVERQEDLPIAVMAAVQDYLETFEGQLNLPLHIAVDSSGIVGDSSQG